jgi:hypothetical protein
MLRIKTYIRKKNEMEREREREREGDGKFLQKLCLSQQLVA